MPSDRLWPWKPFCGTCSSPLDRETGKHQDASYPCPYNNEYQNPGKEPAMTQPALTKEQASDLQSHTNRIVQTELALHNATLARDQAKRILDQFIYDLQHPKQGA